MKFRHVRQAALLLAFTVLLPPSVRAQIPSDDPVENARIQIGPLGVTPSISLTNLGIDSNVFNEVDDPKKDFTVTVSPQLDAWFRAWRSRTELTGRTDLVYFHTYSSERSVDGALNGRVKVPGNRITPWVEGGWASGRQRVGYEIDLRSRRTTTNIALGAEARIGGKTSVAFAARRTKYDFDAGAFFFGSSLDETLNRDSESIDLEYRQALTVLTTFVVQGETIWDRFAVSPGRDTESVSVQTGLDLGSRALISGRVRIGYRKFDGVGGDVPDYIGMIAAFDTGVTILARTRLEISGRREVDYSFERIYPYYVLTGTTLTVTPRLTQIWDVQARLGGQRLAYRALGGSSEAMPNRLDRYVLFGAGIGYHLGRDVRIGFNVDRQRRRSPIQRRDYKGYRIGTAVTYGR